MRIVIHLYKAAALFCAVAFVGYVVVINLFAMPCDSSVDVATSQLKYLRRSLIAYQLAHSRLPPTLELAAKYLDPPELFDDPWGNEYHYQNLDGVNVFLASYGANVLPGGEGEDADICLLTTAFDRGKKGHTND